MEIPIVISSATTEPEKGQFSRLGMDFAVNGAWLAMSIASKEGEAAAVSALSKLFVDLAIRLQVHRRDGHT